MVTASTLVQWLRLVDTHVDDGVLPVVRLAMSDASFAWHTLPTCSNHGWPGIDVGQKRDCRYSTDREDGLHVQTFEQHGYVEIHLDRRDVCRDPVGHAAEDTALVPGLAIGGLLGLLIGLLTRNWKVALAAIGVGLAVGGGIGVNIPKRSRWVMSLVDLYRLVAA